MTRADPPQVADLVVVGGGAAGVAAAIEAGTRLTARRRRVLVVHGAAAGDPGRLVGTGGALLDCARRELSWAQARLRLAQVQRSVERSRAADLRRARVELVRGRGALLGAGQLAVDDGTGVHLIAARRMVLATGALPAVPDLTGLGEVPFLTHRTLLALPEAPGSIVILGAGSRGCELAQALARFGSTVTLVDREDRVLHRGDREISRRIAAALRADGVRLLLGEPVVKLAPTLDGGVWLSTGRGDVAAEAFLITTGRRPAAWELDPQAAGVDVDRSGAILVDAHLATSAAGIWAAGDVTGLLERGAPAAAMGRLAGANAAGRMGSGTGPDRAAERWRRPGGRRWVTPRVARVTHTDPVAATVGLTEAEARYAVPGTVVGDLPVGTLLRAEIGPEAVVPDPGTEQYGRYGDVDAEFEEYAPATVSTDSAVQPLVRLVAAPPRSRRARRRGAGADPASLQLLGAAFVGPAAGEQAALATAAVAAGVTVGELAAAPIPVGGWAEALPMAAERMLRGPEPHLDPDPGTV